MSLCKNSCVGIVCSRFNGCINRSYLGSNRKTYILNIDDNIRPMRKLDCMWQIGKFWSENGYILTERFNDDIYEAWASILMTRRVTSLGCASEAVSACSTSKEVHNSLSPRTVLIFCPNFRSLEQRDVRFAAYESQKYQPSFYLCNIIYWLVTERCRHNAGHFLRSPRGRAMGCLF